MRNMFGIFKISLVGIFILLISTQTFAQSSNPWECDQKKYDTVRIPDEIYITSKRDLKQFCSELLKDDAYDREFSMTTVLENTVYARTGHMCFTSEADTLKKLKNGSMQHSDYHYFKKASNTCKTFLLREWGISGDANAKTGNSSPNQSQSSDSQQAQQLKQRAQESQQQAQQNQQRAEQEVQKGKRRRHEPENEAHHCLTLDKSGLFGGFINKCNFKISYSFCNYNPKKDSWADAHNCVGRAGNGDFVGAGRTSAAHIKNTETVYWFACKDPAWSLDTEYVPGQGLAGRCRTVGGN